MRLYAIFEAYQGTRHLAYATPYRTEAVRLSQTWHEANDMDYEIEQSDEEGFFANSKIIAINGKLV